MNETKLWCLIPEDPYANPKLFNFALTLFIATFGLLANSFVIIINRNIKKQTTTDIYISFLAVTDNLHILSVSLIAYRYVYRYILPEKTDWQDALTLTVIGILAKSFTQCLNTYTIVLLNLDRYIQIKYSTYAKRFCKPNKARMMFAAAILFSVAFVIPKFVECMLILRDPDETTEDCMGYFKHKGGLGFNKVYQLAYGTVGYSIVLYVIPLTTLTVTNVTLISTVCRRRKWLNRIQADVSAKESDRERLQLRSNEISAITTLVAVAIVFMACQIPDMVLQFLWKLAPRLGPTTDMFTHDIVIINSSVNFIIYAVSSSVFRRRLKKVFQPEPESSTTMSS